MKSLHCREFGWHVAGNVSALVPYFTKVVNEESICLLLGKFGIIRDACFWRLFFS